MDVLGCDDGMIEVVSEPQIELDKNSILL
jgi:hypothetical protein